jgi:hypothetical protein
MSSRSFEDYMSTIAFDQFALTRIADFARTLSRLHRASRHRPVEDDQIDREFNAVCLSVWGYTPDDSATICSPQRTTPFSIR